MHIIGLMSVQKYTDKVEVWTSKLGRHYRKDEIDFTATKSELDRIRNLPENRRCADCGVDHGNAWASVNIGVFTCIRCGSFHRALGTHTYLKAEGMLRNIFMGCRRS